MLNRVRPSRAAGAAAAAVVVLAAVGCGGGSGSGDAGSTGTTTAGDPGRALFSSVGCSSCHTLKAAGASGHVGPNLDSLRPSEAQVAKQVTNGGSGMPAFKDQLSSSQIQQVATYVAKVAGR